MGLKIALPVVWLSLPLLTSAGGCGNESLSREPGSSVLIGSATEVAIESLGGGFPSSPPVVGAGCDPQKLRDDIVFASGLLSWTKCQVSGTGTNPTDYVPASGSRTLTASELAELRSAIDAVRVSGRMVCGADKPQLTLTVFQGSDQMVYGDDFYACLKTYSAFVTSETLDPLFATFAQLIGP